MDIKYYLAVNNNLTRNFRRKIRISIFYRDFFNCTNCTFGYNFSSGAAGSMPGQYWAHFPEIINAVRSQFNQLKPTPSTHASATRKAASAIINLDVLHHFPISAPLSHWCSNGWKAGKNHSWRVFFWMWGELSLSLQSQSGHEKSWLELGG